MHSSRMRTARSLPYGGSPSGVDLCPGGSRGGGGLPDRDRPVNGITDMCKNITLLQQCTKSIKLHFNEYISNIPAHVDAS